jgi:hypothetical protein
MLVIIHIIRGVLHLDISCICWFTGSSPEYSSVCSGVFWAVEVEGDKGLGVVAEACFWYRTELSVLYLSLDYSPQVPDYRGFQIIRYQIKTYLLYMSLYFTFLLDKLIHIRPDNGILRLKHVTSYYTINIQVCWWHFLLLLIIDSQLKNSKSLPYHTMPSKILINWTSERLISHPWWLTSCWEYLEHVYTWSCGCVYRT